MYFFFTLAILHLCVVVLAQKIDVAALRPCNDQTGCFPWQECAQCRLKGVDGVYGYCSDISPRVLPSGRLRGLCSDKYFRKPPGAQGYTDDYMTCYCSRNVPRWKLGDDECAEDLDCDTGWRCATCLVPGSLTVFGNKCTDAGSGLLHTFSINACQRADTCSCGQRLPQPRRVSENAPSGNSLGWGESTNLDQNPVIGENLPALSPDAQGGVQQVGVQPVSWDQASIQTGEDGLPIFT